MLKFYTYVKIFFIKYKDNEHYPYYTSMYLLSTGYAPDTPVSVLTFSSVSCPCSIGIWAWSFLGTLSIWLRRCWPSSSYLFTILYSGSWLILKLSRIPFSFIFLRLFNPPLLHYNSWKEMTCLWITFFCFLINFMSITIKIIWSVRPLWTE